MKTTFFTIEATSYFNMLNSTFLHILLVLFTREEVWHLLVCNMQRDIYWCVMCSVASVGVPCAVWHLLVCHVQCGTYWCAMCSVAPIGVPCSVWRQMVCHVQCGIYWCAMCSVAPIGLPCAVWHLLVCHVQCGVKWCATCSTASIGVPYATNFNLTCFRTRFAIPLQVLLLLYFKDSFTWKLTYNTMKEEDGTNGLYVMV